MVANPSSFNYYLGLMKNLLRFLAFVLMVGSAYAQSNLPACQGREAAKWSDCFGTVTLTDGGKYIGEFKDGKYNGQGTFYSSDGSFAQKVTLTHGSLMTSELTVRFVIWSMSSRKIEIPVWFPSNLFFEKDEKTLTVDSLSDIKKVIIFFLENKDIRLLITGAGYNFGSREINLSIGQRLASQVEALLEQGGIDKNRIEAVSSGREKITSERFIQEKANQNISTSELKQNISSSNQPDCQGGDIKTQSNCLSPLTFADGGNYVGESKDGKPHGVGTFTSAYGDKYVGQFKDGKSNGQGTYTYSNGDKYVGEYKDSKPNGLGTLYASNGSVTRQGIWAEGNFVRSESVQQASVANQTVPVVAVKPDNSERDRLAAEVQAERKKRQELEEQLRVAQQSNKQRVPSGIERRVALVIGNSTYRVSPLDNPANDATDITNALNKVGFRTTLIRNATLGQMRDATRKFAEQLQSADVALIYFAGHGIESNRKNYMIPVNADLKFEYELTDQAYDAGSWLEMLETIKSSNSERVNIVILDACRNNNLIGSRSLGSGLGRMDAPTGTFLSYSTAPGKVAADGSKGQRNSPFTRHLLNVIQQPGLQIEEAFKEVRRNVSRDTNGAQVPWESTSLVGKFYFTVQR